MKHECLSSDPKLNHWRILLGDELHAITIKNLSPVFLEADSFKCISIYQFHHFNFPRVLCSFSTVFICEFKRALWSFGKCYVISIHVWEDSTFECSVPCRLFCTFQNWISQQQISMLKVRITRYVEQRSTKKKFKGYEKDNSASLNITKCLQSTFPNLRCFINNQIPFHITQITCIYLLILEF